MIIFGAQKWYYWIRMYIQNAVDPDSDASNEEQPSKQLFIQALAN